MFVENKSIPVTDLGGGVIRKVLAYSKNLMTVELHFEKGAVGAPHSHPHEQIGYIISGKLVYQEEGQEDKILGTGDTYYVARSKLSLHSGKALYKNKRGRPRTETPF